MVLAGVLDALVLDNEHLGGAVGRIAQTLVEGFLGVSEEDAVVPRFLIKDQSRHATPWGRGQGKQNHPILRKLCNRFATANGKNQPLMGA